MNNFESLCRIVDFESLRNIVSECFDWNSSLEDYYYYENDSDFYDMAFSDKMEMAKAIYYGDFDYNDEYVKLNVYGNIETVDKTDYKEILLDNVDEILKTYIGLIINVDNCDGRYFDYKYCLNNDCNLIDTFEKALGEIRG